MVSLNQAILNSPDLTEKHALDLIGKYSEDLKSIRAAITGKGKRGEATLSQTKSDRMRAKSLEIMKNF
jgi:hypothetical protein